MLLNILIKLQFLVLKMKGKNNMENNEILEAKVCLSEEKPEFNDEIKAEITQIGQIEDNIKEVKEYAIKLNEYYSKLIYTPENISEAKEDKSKINKFKDKVKQFRIETVKKYKEPINAFEEMAKNTEKLLAETYDLLNGQTIAYDNSIKEKTSNNLKKYFEEYAESLDIDTELFKFEDLNINVGLSDGNEEGKPKKSIKDKVKAGLDKLKNELDTIGTLNYSDEILLEYKKTKDLSTSISIVSNRHKELEQIQRSSVKVDNVKVQNEEMLNKVTSSLTAPKEEKISQDEILEMTFKVRGTKEKLKELVQFIKDGGYDYE